MVWEVVKEWLKANQNFIFIGIVGISVLVGFLVEFSKKAWKPLEEKYKGDEEKSAKLKVKKGWVSQICAAGLVIFFLDCVRRSTIGIVGGNALLPFWFTLDFSFQFLVSCYGLKSIKKDIDSKKKPKKEKPQYVKAYRDPETGELIEI